MTVMHAERGRAARATLGERLEARRGIGPGFDHLRIGLSLAILFWHSFGISYGNVRGTPLFAQVSPLISTMLPMFFALSGFLVMSSALRINDLRTFVTFRALRILPALATEISLSALVLGPLLTSHRLRDYFTDPLFLQYFGSLVGRVQYMLPGLFADNPAPEVVNGALWTVGPEICCYVIMSMLILTAWYRSDRALLRVAFLYIAACFVSDIVLPPEFFEVLPTKALILGFLAGGLLYHYRYSCPFSPVLALGAFLLALVAIVGAHQGGPWLPLMYVATVLLAFVTVSIGLMDLPPLPFFHRGDYSYGIYIFGYPIQQTIVHFFPSHRVWWFNFALALPITLMFAVASWHLVEKPVLGLRKRLLNKNAVVMPQPIALWTRRQWLIAGALIAYGLFVVYCSDVFPLQRVVHYLMKSPPLHRPPLI